jgi:putative aldouronate transport system substrate-binding protein
MHKLRLAAYAVGSALILASCSGQAPTAQPTATVDMLAPFSAYPEPVTLTFGRQMNRGNQFADGESSTDNVFIDIVKEKLNVDEVVAWETSADVYMQKVELCIASDALPDVFGITSDYYLTLEQLANDGKLADLTDSYRKSVGGSGETVLKERDPDTLSPCTFNGRIMALPTIPTGYNYNLLWIRSDWLKDLGLPLPQTLDDIKNTALAFTQHHMGGPNTVGLIVDPNDFFSLSTTFLSLATVANACGAYPTSWVIDTDGNAVYGSVQPAMKTALGVAADWYRSGVLDPQWMTYQNVDAVTPLLRDGRCGMYFGAYWSPSPLADAMKANPQMDWTYAIAPLDSNGYFRHVNPSSPSTFICVSAKCQHPEAVLKAANVEDELTKGTYDNEPYIKARLDKSHAAGSFGRTIDPFAAGSGAIFGAFDQELQNALMVTNYIKTGTLTPFANASETEKNNAEKAYNWYLHPTRDDTEGYNLYTSYSCLADVYAFPKHYDEAIAWPYATASMPRYWNSLRTMETTTFTQIIAGQLPVDYFDTFVDNWKRSGGDIITEEVNQMIEN